MYTKPLLQRIGRARLEIKWSRSRKRVRMLDATNELVRATSFITSIVSHFEAVYLGSQFIFYLLLFFILFFWGVGGGSSPIISNGVKLVSSIFMYFISCHTPTTMKGCKSCAQENEHNSESCSSRHTVYHHEYIKRNTLYMEPQMLSAD